ncbi:putative serine/threonine-protein kinase nek3 [Diplonema papillatum]|nr:putative serine/threonine-protein kinase nek3 [Diplonema papillatum]
MAERSLRSYDRVRVLGKGSFGEAVLMRAKDTRKYVVIKQVRIDQLSSKEQQEARNEIVILKRLSHPNIVKYVDSFAEGKNLCIVMEYADGGDLANRVKKRSGALFPEEEVLHMFVQLCLAVKHLHDQHILHRDLKSQNIFLTAHPTHPIVKLGDFGISTALQNTMALARTMCGTPYYFSPELCQNKPYNNKSDVWSVGCILYELCTLRHAFQGASMQSLMQRIINGRYAPVSRQYSDPLRHLIDTMLLRDVRTRPSIKRVLAADVVQGKVREFVDAPLPAIMAPSRPAQAPKPGVKPKPAGDTSADFGRLLAQKQQKEQARAVVVKPEVDKVEQLRAHAARLKHDVERRMNMNAGRQGDDPDGANGVDPRPRHARRRDSPPEPAKSPAAQPSPVQQQLQQQHEARPMRNHNNNNNNGNHRCRGATPEDPPFTPPKPQQHHHHHPHPQPSPARPARAPPSDRDGWLRCEEEKADVSKFAVLRRMPKDPYAAAFMEARVAAQLNRNRPSNPFLADDDRKMLEVNNAKRYYRGIDDASAAPPPPPFATPDRRVANLDDRRLPVQARDQMDHPDWPAAHHRPQATPETALVRQRSNSSQEQRAKMPTDRWDDRLDDEERALMLWRQRQQAIELAPAAGLRQHDDRPVRAHGNEQWRASPSEADEADRARLLWEERLQALEGNPRSGNNVRRSATPEVSDEEEDQQDEREYRARYAKDAEAEYQDVKSRLRSDVLRNLRMEADNDDDDDFFEEAPMSEQELFLAPANPTANDEREAVIRQHLVAALGQSRFEQAFDALSRGNDAGAARVLQGDEALFPLFRQYLFCARR